MKFFLILVFFYLLRLIFKNLFLDNKSTSKQKNVIDAEFEELE